MFLHHTVKFCVEPEFNIKDMIDESARKTKVCGILKTEVELGKSFNRLNMFLTTLKKYPLPILTMSICYSISLLTETHKNFL